MLFLCETQKSPSATHSDCWPSTGQIPWSWCHNAQTFVSSHSFQELDVGLAASLDKSIIAQGWKIEAEDKQPSAE